MLSGRRLDLLDPTPVDVEVGDIAHGLAFVARWNGQTAGDWPYSVAEHSLLVERLFGRIGRPAGPGWHLAALLHDAPEYVIGDMISPVKRAIGPDYGAMEERLAAAIHRRFGLPAVLPAEIKVRIKQADRISARIEAERIAGFSQKEAARFFPLPRRGAEQHIDLAEFPLELRPPAQTRDAFLNRFSELMAQIDKAQTGTGADPFACG